MGFNLADLLESVVAVAGGREAVVCAAGGGDAEVRLTYRQLDERADRLAHVLAGHGVGRDDAVGLVLRNGNELLEGLFACFKLRAVPVAISTRATPADVAAVLDDCRAVAILHEPDLAGLVAEVAVGPDGRPPATLARGGSWEAALAAAPTGPVAVGPRSGDDRYLLYTGGTTGRPKGVRWRHEDLFFAALGGGDPGGEPVTDPAEVAAAATAGAGRSRCLPASPLHHGTGQWSALTTLLGGGTVVLVRDERLDARRLLEVVADEGVTFLVVVGDAFCRPLVEALAGLDVHRLAALTVVLSGGATLAPSTIDALLRLLPWTVVVDGFGTSETGGQGQRISYPGTADRSGPPTFAMGPDTVVLDDDLRPVAPGDGREGWLARRGRLPVGYLGDETATAATFRTVDDVRWAVPGDRAVIEADGTVRVLGRGATVINTGGEKVHVEEVEVVVRSHPAVTDAVVVGSPDERWGEVVTAVASLRAGATLDAGGLRDHCRAVLAPHKLPRRLVLVDEIVRGPAGKPDLGWARAAAAGA